MNATTALDHSRTESQLAAIWAEVLEVSEVELTDDFFRLGGTSLLALQISGRISEALGKQVSPLVLFEAPTIAALARMLDEGTRRPSNRSAQRISRLGRDRGGGGTLKMSRLQEYLACVPAVSSPPMPHSREACLLTGRVNVVALERALRDLLERHGTLTAAFPTLGHRPHVRQIPIDSVKLEQIDLRKSAASRRSTEVRERIRRIQWTPFDLENGPLIRMALLRLRPDIHALVLVAHELICDVWSLELLVDELSQCYSAALRDEPPFAVAAPQYFDIVRSAALDRTPQSSYWEKLLADAPLTLPFPFDAGGFADGSMPVTEVTLELSDDLYARLQALAAEERCTPFMLHMAAYSLLLNRYTGERTPLLRTHAARRPTLEQEKAVGYFTYVLPTWVEIASEGTFRELLRRTRERTLELFTHADNELLDYSPLKLIDGVRGLSKASITFRHFGKTQRPLPDFPEVRAERLVPFREAGSLVMLVDERPDSNATVTLLSESVDRKNLKSMLQHHHHLLESISKQPDGQLATLPIVTSSEAAGLFEMWNGEVLDDGEVTDSVVTLVERQAEKTPSAVAARAGSSTVTYSELIVRTRAAAASLRGSGVKPGDLVGIAIPPSIELVVAMLASLRVGAAFTSLEGHPDAAPTVDDGPQITVLVGHSELAAPAPREHPFVDLADEPAESSDDTPSCEVELDDVAAVVATAGVTGPPKHVSLTHRTLAHSAIWQRRAYSIDGSDRVLSSPGPGAMTWALAPWAPLASGAEAVCPAIVGEEPPLAISAQLRRDGVTTARLPASLAAAALAEHGDELRSIIVPGPVALPAREVDLTVFREYTITEAGGPVATTKLRGPDLTAERMSISSERARVKAFVLDEALAVLPPDAVGTLYLAGAGIARDYYGQPELSARAFVADPSAHGKMVCTGDLARRHPDGTIEVIGRIADEVRFRGFRLNSRMQQLEEALAASPAVEAAATRWDPTTSSLVAYIVAGRDILPTPQDLNPWVTQHVESPLLPSHYVAIEVIPVRCDGMVDRGVLARVPGTPLQNPSPSPVQVQAEQKLLRIWKKVLKRRRVRTTDNFYALGGDTPLLFEMYSHARRAGIKLTGDTSQCRTIVDFASLVRE